MQRLLLFLYNSEKVCLQIPHWMFTFTASGTDLLTLTLGMVASRDGVYEWVRVDVIE